MIFIVAFEEGYFKISKAYFPKSTLLLLSIGRLIETFGRPTY